jgi:hypothetical protein
VPIIFEDCALLPTGIHPSSTKIDYGGQAG